MTTTVYQIADFLVDAFVTEEHTAEVEVTTFPVEEGSDITDHARILPDVVMVEGIVTDSPLAAMVNARVEGSSPSKEARERFLEIVRARELITVVTSDEVFPAMMMTSVSFPKSAGNGEACRFRAMFKRIEIVKNKRSTLRVAAPRIAKKVKRGKKAPEIPDNSAKIEELVRGMHRESVLHAGSERAFGDSSSGLTNQVP